MEVYPDKIGDRASLVRDGGQDTCYAVISFEAGTIFDASKGETYEKPGYSVHGSDVSGCIASRYYRLRG
jgi:hypothetical protein